MIVLNVGGGPTRTLPPEYAGWDQDLLDIDPTVLPDVCMDALRLVDSDPDEYDAVYCSNNIEHFYAHEVPVVLSGFRHVLRPGGKAEIVVPHIVAMIAEMLENNLDLTDTWYRTGEGVPITFHDVLYGWNAQLAQIGRAHV